MCKIMGCKYDNHRIKSGMVLYKPLNVKDVTVNLSVQPENKYTNVSQVL